MRPQAPGPRGVSLLLARQVGYLNELAPERIIQPQASLRWNLPTIYSHHSKIIRFFSSYDSPESSRPFTRSVEKLKHQIRFTGGPRDSVVNASEALQHITSQAFDKGCQAFLTRLKSPAKRSLASHQSHQHPSAPISAHPAAGLILSLIIGLI